MTLDAIELVREHAASASAPGCDGQAKPSWASAARSTKPSTLLASAPDAMRMPIRWFAGDGIRCYAVHPTQARISASTPNNSESRAMSRS